MKRSALVVVAAFVLFISSPAKSPASLTDANSRKPAVGFTLTDANGAPVKLADYRGRVVLLDFWATFCGVCKTEIPWFIEFQNKYKAGGLSVIGVALDKDWSVLNPYIKEREMNYTVVLGSFDLAGKFGVVNALPGTLLIDRNGRIADIKLGMVNRVAFESEIRTLLKESTPAHK